MNRPIHITAGPALSLRQFLKEGLSRHAVRFPLAN
jgi:hypothetical protein